VIVGLWSFTLDWDKALHFVVLGMLLTVFTYFVKDSHKMLGSLAMISTIVSTLLLGIFFFFLKDSSAVYVTPIAIMTTSGFFASLAYMQCAINHKQQTDSCDSEETTCCDSTQTTDKNLKKTGCC